MADQDQAQDSWVEIAHDGIDGTARVHPRSVPHWERRGWSVRGPVEAPLNAAPVQVAAQETAAVSPPLAQEPGDVPSPARRR